MKILSIDTSGQQANAAIMYTPSPNNYIIVGEINLNARTGEKSWTHSEILMPGIDSLFHLTGTNPQDIDYIAYTNGPGSFTGLRIGASTAIGLAAGLNKPTIAVPTLDALAYNMLSTGNTGLVVPMMDARREQVYSAVYAQGENGKLTRESEYMAVSIEEIVQLVTESHQLNICFLGDGACANKNYLQTSLPHAIFASPNNNRLRASSAGIWAIEQIQSGRVLSDKVEILYVRAPQAVQDLAKRQKHD